MIINVQHTHMSTNKCKPDVDEADTDVGIETVLNVAEDGNGTEEDGP
jgi:hypothetical protein